MITDKRTRALPSRQPEPPTAEPVQRELVTVTTQELRERCLRCGHLVLFKTLKTYKDDEGIVVRRYVQCPDCREEHHMDPIQDTIRRLT
jgi:DNA-directed RNA polymerase subunit RPC12/RpoP